MSLSKHAEAAIARDLRMYCFAFIAGADSTSVTKPALVKFEHFKDFCRQLEWSESYIEQLNIETFQLWLREYRNAQ